MSNVKDVVEALDLLEKLGTCVAEVMEDGKVNILDLPKVAKLWSPAQAAIEGLKNLPEQIKTMDTAAVQEVLLKVVLVGQAWMPVFTKKKPA